MSSARRPAGSMPNVVERVRELDAAAADVRMIGRAQRDERRRRRPARRPSTRPGRRRGPGRRESARAPARATARARVRRAAASRRVLPLNFGSLSAILQFCNPAMLGSSSDDPVARSRRDAVRQPCASSAPCARAEALGGQLARPVEAEERRVGRLGAGRVLAGGLAELLRAALDVEDVVDDLKREPDFGGAAGRPRRSRVVARRP